MKSHTSVCCRHFPGGDITKDPQTGLGKRFASPKKNDTPRAKSANRKEVTKHWSSVLESPVIAGQLHLSQSRLTLSVNLY